MNETVEVSGGLLDGLAHVVFAVEVEDIGNEVEGVLIVVDFGVQAGEVEAVGEVLFVDFAEVFVAAGGDELGEIKSVGVLENRQFKKKHPFKPVSSVLRIGVLRTKRLVICSSVGVLGRMIGFSSRRRGRSFLSWLPLLLTIRQVGFDARSK